MTVDRAWIAAHIPHQGQMCLLDEVIEWNLERIVCTATSHLDPHNPLRAEGRLGIANGIEYGAQAMALHGALLATADERLPAGYLTSVRNVVWHHDRLDDLTEALTITAERLSGDDKTIIYQLALHCSGREILSGRASVVMNQEGLSA